jgi:simple sugar transport system ATP-binding protein
MSVATVLATDPAAAAPMRAPSLETIGMTKVFGSLVALDDVSINIKAGTVHALLGENGAGKSTLVKCIMGFYSADKGQVLLDGAEVPIRNPRDARALGIGMVFQNFTLVPALSVFDNVALFQKNLPAVVPRAEILKRMRHYAERFRLTLDPWMQAGQLAVGDQQKVEILKQLLAGARVLILDEPTKVLAPQESEGLFKTLTELRAQGLGIVLITHKLREVLACADRIAVMRHGRVVGVVGRREAKEENLLALMFGDKPMELPSPLLDPAGRHDRGVCALEMVGVSTTGGAGHIPLRNVSMKLRSGEIVGVAGVSGNGQREFGDLILGLLQPETGSKLLWGEDASRWSIAAVRDKGVASIPDDPLALACVPGLTVRENLVLGSGARYSTGLGVDWPRLDADMNRSFARLGFSRPNFESRAATLSGGNLQRVVLARELAQQPRLIVALYPTRGLDARSTIMVRALLRDMRDRGAAVLLISEDLDELFEVSDRLLVLFHGAVAAEFSPEDFRADLVGPPMIGVTEHSDAA